MRDNSFSRMLAEIKRLPLEHIIGQYADLRKTGTGKYKACCPFHAEHTPSFHVNEGKGNWRCYGCGEHGSVIDFVMKIENMPFKEAVAYCARQYGLDESDTPAPRKTPKAYVRTETETDAARIEREISRARDIYRMGVTAAGSIVETYLRETRGIPLHLLPGGMLPPTILYVPALELWHTVRGKAAMIGEYPAMISPLKRMDGAFRGVHITYLDPATANKIAIADPDGGGKSIPAKKIRGTAWGSCMRFGPAAPRMGAGEGTETCLSLMALTGMVYWACMSIHNLAGLGVGDGEKHPRRADRKLPSIYPDLTNPENLTFPDIVEELWLGEDADSKDPESAAALYERAGRRHVIKPGGGKRKIFRQVPDKGMDWNDMVKAATRAKQTA